MTTITADISSISRVPVLQTDGANWLIFSTRPLGHFDGTTSRPVPPAAQADIDEWEKHEDESRNHLAQKLEDTTFLQADEKSTVAEMWEWISNEFTALSAHVVASMQADFDNCNCGESGNVCMHLDLLKMKHRARYLATITSSAKAALVATNLARSVAAAAAASSTAPAAGMTIASGNTASTQAITLAPAYLMQLALPSKSREDTGVALSAQPTASSSSSSSNKSR
ncbi:hypothetical protein B0H10DRAFT_1990620, partial [Mycena sp. CBHHK59/15]